MSLLARPVWRTVIDTMQRWAACRCAPFVPYSDPSDPPAASAALAVSAHWWPDVVFSAALTRGRVAVVVIDGKRGAGKSTALAATVVLARQAGWLAVYLDGEALAVRFPLLVRFVRASRLTPSRSPAATLCATARIPICGTSR